jgi:threonine/homoserine/homoserine lactone efflux protein
VLTVLLFILTISSILATPGPTNTLLATAGATVGIYRASLLVTAEALGYGVSVALFGVFLKSLVTHDPLIGIGLRLILCVYLLHVAWRLFRSGRAVGEANGDVTWCRVFLTTLLNPKALVFALVVIPFGTPQAGMYLALFFAILLPISLAWISLGVVLGQAARRTQRDHMIAHVGAGALCVFAVVLAASATRI